MWKSHISRNASSSGSLVFLTMVGTVEKLGAVSFGMERRNWTMTAVVAVRTLARASDGENRERNDERFREMDVGVLRVWVWEREGPEDCGE